MTRYIALLRGINISGKNKISMPELKTALTEKGFADVKTYLNSGNVLFSDDETDAVKLAEKIRKIIFETFNFEIPVFVISQDELKDLLSKAPSWWGSDSKDIYDNLIFAIAPHSIETSSHTGISFGTLKGQTPPGAKPVIASTGSMKSIFRDS